MNLLTSLYFRPITGSPQQPVTPRPSPGVNIEVLYSDHDHRLILAVDNFARGQAVSDAWTTEEKPKRKEQA